MLQSFLAVSLAVSLLQAQPAAPESLRILALQARINAGDAAAAGNFWKTLGQAPIIEDTTSASHKLVTFVWRGDPSTRHVVVMSELGGYTDFRANMMRKIAGTDIWYLSYVVRDDARFTYFIAPDDPMTPLGMEAEAMARRLAGWKTDPLNPRQTPVPGRMASYVELPAAPPQPFVARRENVTRGSVTLTRFKSSVLGNERQLSIYTPPGYAAEGDPYPVLILLDGYFYSFLIPAPTILDNMAADRVIRTPVTVVIDTLFDRDRELSCNPEFSRMVADELLPWIRARYHVSDAAADVAIGGSSLGGLGAACAAFHRADVVGGVISQSGSFWWAREGEQHERLRRLFDASERKPIRFYLDVGLMETGPIPGDGPDMVTVNRRLYSILQSKGYPVTYQEFNGGHEFLNWRGTFADALRAMFPAKPR